ncbi:hypothetical protein NPA08_00810 [Mycoplasmopsis citelli]|uniref:hypothetical protein n=1 Tax=Mycoplasmopsis citelli TaxID=171281 RepID=UPI0021154897|nr:hypothetical protein [Mycoplasmopsis citelli]UUD36365.1 hypothetical protein NPA08_00810 [Mycoplasmopsis citelli]
MKSLFLKVGEPVANLSQISSVISTSSTLEKHIKIKEEATLSSEKILSEISKELTIKNSDILDEMKKLIER